MWLPSVFSVFRHAVGPSSSHTLGPIRAAHDFRRALAAGDLAGGRIQVVLLGSLALTGKGHLSDLAVAAGLAGFDPRSDRDTLIARAREVRAAREIRAGGRAFAFEPETDIVLEPATEGLPHPNTLRFRVLDPAGAAVFEQEYLSVGGGEVRGGGFAEAPVAAAGERPSMTAIVDECLRDGVDLAGWALEAEQRIHGRGRDEVHEYLDEVWDAMAAAIDRGLAAEGLLPGRLQLERRAAEMFGAIQRNIRQWRVLSRETTLASAYALAVAEENASGGRVVTAPTCGSAGILPAVLMIMKERFHLSERRVHDALLVAGVVGGLVAHNASISGADVGCQGEVGTASAMAAAAVCHLLDGSVPQVESAAEMALEHHLGLTCDPVFGLVQIPCIERNAVGAVAALNAANLSLLSTGRHLVTFDAVVATMRQVGHDMSHKYKETALGGLAAAPLARR